MDGTLDLSEILKLTGGVTGGGLAAYGFVVGFRAVAKSVQGMIARRNGHSAPTEPEIVWQCHFDRECKDAVLRLPELLERRHLVEDGRDRRADDAHARMDAALTRILERDCPRGGTWKP